VKINQYEYEKLKKENQSLRKKLQDLHEDFIEYKKLHYTAFDIGDAISDGICVVDSDGIVRAINRGYTEITGIKEEEIVGHYVEEMIKAGYLTKAVIEVINSKKKVSAMSTLGKHNNKVLLTGNPLFDDDGNLIQVLTVMRNITELLELKAELEEAQKHRRQYLDELRLLKEKGLYGNLLGVSPSMNKIKKLIDHVAKTDATVLITGETGVGKEVIANEIYSRSKRNNKPFVKVNCSAIPETLLESELFGYVKGAFTGADNKDKIGLFELADKGTILLDEIGEMPIKLQSKLLRVLQEREITRVGGNRSIPIDIRIIAATNQNLEELIKKNLFREDLYYRLNVIPIEAPPLRERKEDIPVLAHSFLKKYNEKYEKNKYLTKDSIRVLNHYHWPGNVRELENIIERLIIIDNTEEISAESVISIIGDNKFSEHFMEEIDLPLKEAVRSFEKKIIEKTLKKYKNTYKAAEVLGVTQPTVVRKAQSLGIKNWK
jgi:PAS domain S-box-containing protein